MTFIFQVNILNALSLIMVFASGLDTVKPLFVYNNTFVLYTKMFYLLSDLITNLRTPVFEKCLL
ncbi:hypothetical protein MCM1_3614 [Methanosarcina barkeri CM1]|uniref:Uncharacterized protein n=1 Tax=Methanosarcina barkeri CM1 TaxID=796385 RepID=A0A0G3CN85_METBA|nr:hypothetical protein MCM1_3614 [Methanosarcina barkeri CM1]